MAGHIQARPREAHAFPVLPRRHTLAGEMPHAARLDLSSWRAVGGHPGFYARSGEEMNGHFLFNANTGFAGYQNPRLTRLSVKVFEEGCFTDAVSCKTTDTGEPFAIWIVFSPAEEGCLASLDRFTAEAGCDRVDLIFPDWATGAYTYRPKDCTLRPICANVALDESGFAAIWDSPALDLWKPPFFYYDHKLADTVRATRIKPGETMPQAGFGDFLDEDGGE